ncbi:MAG: hypothetical protein EXR05_11280 [Acetobacteraceae bacterium]|nr:hypothetical protein [Acetobacteraceae bacterium]MSP30605.1 hypothetical protein [Acetobacteraceae bacterium]
MEPELALRWKNPSPSIWCFHLRPGVKFRGGQAFTADDVVSSICRATGPGPQINAYFVTVEDVGGSTI